MFIYNIIYNITKMESFDGAEVCQLVGLNLLDKLSKERKCRTTQKCRSSCY